MPRSSGDFGGKGLSIDEFVASSPMRRPAD
jgi:hypothetical protein